VQLLSCPSCGAPLSVPAGALATLCHYCNCSLRVSAGESASGSSPASSAAPLVTVDTSIAPATIARIKAVLLLGKRDEAVAMYENEARCDRPSAEATIDAYTMDAAASMVLGGRITAAGMAIYMGAIALAMSAIVLATLGLVPWGIATVVVLIGAAWTLLFTGRALRTLRYLRATVGAATVVRFALIGHDNSNSLFRLLLDVHDPSGSTFRVERSLLLGPAHAALTKEGHRFRVKYFGSDPESVVYDGELPVEKE
jgi:hypothetical protein